MRIVRMAIVVFSLVLAQFAIALKAQDGQMNYGPCLCHSVTFVKPENKDARTWDGAITRAMVVSLPHDTSLCYDIDRLTAAALWQGGFLDTSKTHHTSYKGSLPPRPAAPTAYENLQSPGWSLPDRALKAEELKFEGHYLYKNNVVLSYRIAGRHVLESPDAAAAGVVRRNLQIDAGDQEIVLLIGMPGGHTSVAAAPHVVTIGRKDGACKLQLTGNTKGLAFAQELQQGSLALKIPPGERTFSLWMACGEAEIAALDAAVTKSPDAPKLDTMIQGGPRRWKETIIRHGELGEEKGAYAVDNLPVPERPYGSWMRLSAVDFFADGRCAVATMPGDVWIVTFNSDDLKEIRWQRFATGLYEPLGLRVVDGKIYVRGRDRITRLHDLNNDGEADSFENFHSHGPIGPGYHAFLFDLVTDKEGNFYYAISGRKAPSQGEVIKLSPDGKNFEMIATHFRHPNGLGSGGPHDWLTIADNPDGKFPSGASIVRAGQSYGEGGPRTQPFLYLLPPKVDSSSGSQCWADAKRWGPLSGKLIHTSYSTSTLCYVTVQDTKPHPNGFAVQLPFGFKSGIMRLQVNPKDGQMYVAGQRGWDSNAAKDGCLHRVRYTGKPECLLTGAKATSRGVQLTFSSALDESTVDFDNFYAARVGDKQEKEVDIDDVESVDERTVLVIFAKQDIDPSDLVDEQAAKKLKDGRTHYRVLEPLAITFNMKANDGTPVKDTVYCTINSLAN